MEAVAGRIAAPLTSRSTWRRWAHLIMGGALVMPYVILGTLIASWLGRPSASLVTWTVVFLLSLPLVAATALAIPSIRTVEVTAAGELLGRPAAALASGAARSWEGRWRSAGWFVLHLSLGGVGSGLTLSMPPLALTLFVAPWADVTGRLWSTWEIPAAPIAGVAILLGTVYLVAGAGAVLARTAPVLLGPTSGERLAELQQRADRLAERNRLARDLHDSVGHALTNTTLQAGAAGRLLDTDPEFVRRALTAIEETGRTALDDLDHVLGLLREEPADGADAPCTGPGPSLHDLDGLLANTRAAGLTIDTDITAELDRVPATVSREGYRVVQEGLTNVLRHAGKVPVTVRLAARSDTLELEMSNPMPGGEGGRPANDAERGGRGLDGIRERVAVLRGRMSAAADGGQWRVTVHLPLGRPPRDG